MYQITDCFQPGTTIYRHGCGVKKSCIQVNSAGGKQSPVSYKEITWYWIGAYTTLLSDNNSNTLGWIGGLFNSGISRGNTTYPMCTIKSVTWITKRYHQIL